MHDPFAHLNLEQIQNAERKYPAQHPVLWRVAEFVVFVQGTRKWMQNWWRRGKIGYDAGRSEGR